MILVSKKESYSNNFVKIIFGGQETKKLLYRVFETFMCMPSHICWGWAGRGLANYSMYRFLLQNQISVLSY